MILHPILSLAMSDEPPNRVFSDEEFVQAVIDNGPVGTIGVAEIVGCVYETARGRLEQLEENGEIEQTTIGGSSVWYME